MDSRFEDDQLRLQKAVWAYLDGTIADDELSWLDSQIATNPQAANLLTECTEFETSLEYTFSQSKLEANVSELLLSLKLGEGQCLPHEASGNPSRHPTARLSKISQAALAIACTVLIGLTVWQFLRADSHAQVARVTSSVDALWYDNQAPDPKGWLPSGMVRLERGQAEIHFTSGARLVVEAPAEFSANSPVEARLGYGKLTAKVDGSKTDFQVLTPMANVHDHGTEFGVSVDREGETSVAVFDGMVDLALGGDASTRSRESVRRLSAGEALSVDKLGALRRLTTVRDDSFPTLIPSRRRHPSTTPLIAEVRDNLRDDDSPKFYRIVTRGLVEDAPAYVDRHYQWNGVDKKGIPAVLRGADYIMPFNDDKSAHRLQVMLTVSQPATLFILYDDRAQKPTWLVNDYLDTGSDIGMDEGLNPNHPEYKFGVGPGHEVDFQFSIWRRDISEPQIVELGASGRSVSRPSSPTGARSMYGIAIVPLLDDRENTL